MKKVIAKHWKIDENTVRLQIKTKKEQDRLNDFFADWDCVSYGFIPRTSEEIYIFEKKFKSQLDWQDFLNSNKQNTLIEMKEVKNVQ
jgi:hypothetical protein|tara:strand:+ start:234 stop:494 length:261 start_codon:yes stop_codon:yes gene_type:complete